MTSAVDRTPRTGAPTKLTRATQRAVVKALRQGNYLAVAARQAGIHRVTLNAWLKKGAEAQQAVDRGEELTGDAPRYLAFRVAVQEAEAQAEADLVARWSAATRHDWRAAAELLARRHPDKWSPTKSVTLTTEASNRRVAAAQVEVLEALGLPVSDELREEAGLTDAGSADG